MKFYFVASRYDSPILQRLAPVGVRSVLVSYFEPGAARRWGLVEPDRRGWARVPEGAPIAARVRPVDQRRSKQNLRKQAAEGARRRRLQPEGL